MNIDAETRVMARLHNVGDKKGLNIYNPYFEAANVNAVYLLFRGPLLQPLLHGLIDFDIPGAIPAGFEKYPELIASMDSLDPIAEKVGKIGMVRQRNGKLEGHYQPGYGLTQAIKESASLKDKVIVMLGSGHVTHAFFEHLTRIDELPREVHLYNRTNSNAEKLASLYPRIITRVGNMEEMTRDQGDIFINTTYIGSRSNKGEEYNFSEDFIQGFEHVADVAFVPLHSQLIELAKKLEKTTTPGWKMFVHQGAYCLQTILDIAVDTGKLSEIAYKDFTENWK